VLPISSLTNSRTSFCNFKRPTTSGHGVCWWERKRVKAKVYRAEKQHGSWRPRSLIDRRGPLFPDDYRYALTIEAEPKSLDGSYESLLGDVVVFTEEDIYVAAPFGWERVKLGATGGTRPQP
jgi:hypothetical protein